MKNIKSTIALAIVVASFAITSCKKNCDMKPCHDKGNCHHAGSCCDSTSATSANKK